MAVLTKGQREGGFMVETKIVLTDPLTAFRTSLKERLSKTRKKRPKAQPTPGKEENPLGRRAPPHGRAPALVSAFDSLCSSKVPLDTSAAFFLGNCLSYFIASPDSG